MKCEHELDGESTIEIGEDNDGETVVWCYLCLERIEPDEPYDFDDCA